MASRTHIPRTRSLSERLSALLVLSSLAVVPLACAQKTPDPAKTEQQAAKADPAAPADAAPSNPCAPKKKPKNPCE
ncbi:MAG TPA: hypothetical protein VN259_07815 [Xanthomonadales bacterium]|nr:hypothetical protein [Xanthomonadales bacterium]